MMQERLDSSGRGMNEYSAHNRPDDQDGPAAARRPPAGPGQPMTRAPGCAARCRATRCYRRTFPPHPASQTPAAAKLPAPLQVRVFVPSQREVTPCIGEKLYLGCRRKYRLSQAQTLILFVSEEDSGLFNIHFTWQGPTSLLIRHLHILAAVEICFDLQESLPNAHLRLRTSLMPKSSKPARARPKRHPRPANLQDRASRLLK